MRPYLDASRHRPRVHLSEAQRGCLHSGGSSCDRCHAGKRNVVIRPIAEIDDRSTARPNTRTEGADACPEHRSGLPRLLPFPLRRVERNLLDNVRRVHLSRCGNRSRQTRTDRKRRCWERRYRTEQVFLKKRARERESEKEKKMNRRYEKVRSVSFRNSCIVNRNENGH